MAKHIDRKSIIKFGENLRRLREAKNLSLRDVALNCNIDNGQISIIEQGKVNITLNTLFELAKGLNLPAKELLDF